MTAFKNLLLNVAWIIKIQMPFFAALIGLAILITSLISGLFLINAEPSQGVVLETLSKPITIDGRTEIATSLIVGYTHEDEQSTASISPAGAAAYIIGEKVPLLVSGAAVKVDSMGELFGVPVVLTAFLVLLIILHLLLKRVNYEPKGWNMGSNWFKRYD